MKSFPSKLLLLVWYLVLVVFRCFVTGVLNNELLCDKPTLAIQYFSSALPSSIMKIVLLSISRCAVQLCSSC